MLVFRDREGRDRAAARACNDDGNLEREIELLLEHAGHRTHRLPCRPRPIDRCDARLPLAVVAEPGRFQYAGQQPGVQAVEVAGFGDDRMRSDPDAARREETLFADAVLRDRHARGLGTDCAMLCEKRERRRRHVLELGGGGAAAAREFGERSFVEVIGTEMIVGNGAGRAVPAGVEHADLVAQRLRGHAEHAPKLSAAQQPEPAARGNRCGHRRGRIHGGA